MHIEGVLQVVRVVGKNVGAALERGVERCLRTLHRQVRLQELQVVKWAFKSPCKSGWVSLRAYQYTKTLMAACISQQAAPMPILLSCLAARSVRHYSMRLRRLSLPGNQPRSPEGLLGRLVQVVVLLHQFLQLALNVGQLGSGELVLVQGDLRGGQQVGRAQSRRG